MRLVLCGVPGGRPWRPKACPEIFDTDQGSQYHRRGLYRSAEEHMRSRISMDGKGRALDNVMIERLWRTVKYDDIYIRCYETMSELYQG